MFPVSPAKSDPFLKALGKLLTIGKTMQCSTWKSHENYTVMFRMFKHKPNYSLSEVTYRQVHTQKSKVVAFFTTGDYIYKNIKYYLKASVSQNLCGADGSTQLTLNTTQASLSQILAEQLGSTQTAPQEFSHNKPKNSILQTTQKFKKRNNNRKAQSPFCKCQKCCQLQTNKNYLKSKKLTIFQLSFSIFY